MGVRPGPALLCWALARTHGGLGCLPGISGASRAERRRCTSTTSTGERADASTLITC